MKSNEIEFLKELTKLSKKYGIIVGGCGCCSSPFLAKMEEEEKNGHYGEGNRSEFEWKSKDD